MTDESDSTKEIERLRERISTLENLLATHEETSVQQSRRLEGMIEELQHRAGELAQSESALRRQSTILHWMLDNMTDGLVVLDEQGTHLLSNKAADTITGSLAMGLKRPADPPGEESERTLLPDAVTPCPVDQEPLLRALRGEEGRNVELYIRRPRGQKGVFVSVNATPLRDESGIRGAIAVFRDVTERKRQEDELEAKRRQLLEAERAKSEALERLQESQADLIRKQQIALQELSTPVLDLWDDILALPIIGTVDARRSSEIMERLLGEVVAKRCRFVILDVTGVELIDTQTASHFLAIARAVELLGARCVLTGVRPAVAQTIVQLDVDLGALKTLRNLKHGLRYCISTRQREAALRARGDDVDQDE
jgi:rsbT co-antagonist protein RsbR